MARRVRRTPRSGKSRAPARRSRRSGPRVYAFRSYAHDLQQAITELLGFPRRLIPTRQGGWTPVLALLAGLLMVFSRAATLTGRFWEAAAALKQTCRGFHAQSYQGWAKALRRNTGLLKLLAAALRDRVLQLQDRPGPRLTRWHLLAVDGSRFNLPRTAACRRFAGSAGKKGTAPQLYLTCLYDVATGLVWDYRIGQGTASERAHLLAMLQDLPENVLVLADAGFVGHRSSAPAAGMTSNRSSLVS